MGDPKGFLKTNRQNTHYRPVCERIKDFKEVFKMRSDIESKEQASRCMDCGTPFCHWACPLGNYIPEWNDYMFHNDWKEAFLLLEATNNLPEITGRICPAMCEHSCVLGINNEPVTIRENELAVIEYAFDNGLVAPKPPGKRTGKKAAVIGSGPAGLSCAAQLNRAGHNTIVFERDDKPGGILRYGIPDFKLEKNVLDRRIGLWKKEGIKFKTNVNVGIDYGVKDLLNGFDAVCFAGGSRLPRDLDIGGRSLKGIYFAMEYLTRANEIIAGKKIDENKPIDAKGKKVVVIGGGDTGADCVGTAHRQGASCVVQIEVMPKPAECRTAIDPWPQYPMFLKTSSSHQEGGERHWSVLTKEFTGEKGCVNRLKCVKVQLLEAGPKTCPAMKEMPGSEFFIEADLVIVAVGFLHPEHHGLLSDLGVAFDKRGNVQTGEDHMTSVKKVFCAGDARRGQSLVVWAISEGRRCAQKIDKFLMGESRLPLI